jgi:D-glycero-alpha-D-manno-heptose-7-phosphate kinase
VSRRLESVTARAPARVSFGGGGTDLAAYYAPHGGLVVSAAIARYATVTVAPAADGATRIHSADYGLSVACPPGERFPVAPPLALPKAAVAWFAGRGWLREGVELWLTAEAPPGGGLGSSSAMAVALARALAGYCGLALSNTEIAELACWIEIERLEMPIGKQDQYASAYGGLNELTFSAAGVCVRPLPLAPQLLAQLDRRLLLFATGRARDSADVLRGQRADSAANPAVIARLDRLKALAAAMRDALLAGDLDGFGALLDAGWQEKRCLSTRISAPDIDAWYATARAAGALGGKLTGAGAGGHLLLYCSPARQPDLRAALTAQGLRELPFTFAPAVADAALAAKTASVGEGLPRSA